MIPLNHFIFTKMSVVDAAIIKALVEHIDGDTWTTMEQATDYVPALITSDGKTYVGIEKKTDAVADLFGSRLYLENTNGVVSRLVVVKYTSDNITFMGERSLGDENDFQNELIVPKVEIEGKEYYMRQDWTPERIKFETMRFNVKLYESYADPIVQKTLLRHCISKLAT